MRTLNLGILAHVDAGKTSLTERLLYDAGVIRTLGSVDAGSTQTDGLALERQHGITIKSAVASFVVAGVAINLIDTPGHPDFIAEVERVLNVLDGAVLVISAVEGVQAQTRVLMRTLQRLGIPTIIFINKIDRSGADPGAVLRAIAERLTPAIIPMGSAHDLGRREAAFAPFDRANAAFRMRLAERLAENDEAILAAYLGGERPLSYARLRRALGVQTRQSLICPVFLGSAITGAGVAALVDGVAELLPGAEADAEAPASGAVFKVERGAAGEKIAYVRMFAGAVHVRDRLAFGRGKAAKVTALSVFDGGPARPAASVAAGRIGKLWGLADIQIGDAIGPPRGDESAHHFAPPTLETVVLPSRHSERGALLGALAQLAEQDPLINLRQDDIRQEIYVSLYGEVQKEVIRETLANDFGVEVEFRETTPICVERPIGVGASAEFAPRPLMATVGLRVDPAPIGSGVRFRLEVDVGSMPQAFFAAVEASVRETLREGLSGWQVTDCTVAMTEVLRYRHFATSTPADHRNLAPLVLMAALKQAGTTVCEPIHRFRMTLPADTLAVVVPLLSRLGAGAQTPEIEGTSCRLDGDIRAANVHALQQALPGLTRGEGVLEAAFDHYRPVRGATPIRPRTSIDPLDREEYLRQVARRG
jgi:ribosomal protection tetracycline resistance protein